VSKLKNKLEINGDKQKHCQMLRVPDDIGVTSLSCFILSTSKIQFLSLNNCG